jgi:hypothetical protein
MLGIFTQSKSNILGKIICHSYFGTAFPKCKMHLTGERIWGDFRYNFNCYIFLMWIIKGSISTLHDFIMELKLAGSKNSVDEKEIFNK